MKREQNKLKKIKKLKKMNLTKPAVKMARKIKKFAVKTKLSLRGQKKINQIISHSYSTRLSVRGANKKAELAE